MLDKNIKILIAETSINNAMLIEKYLSEYGLSSTAVCGDAIDALKYFNDEDFDVLIINWMLPGIAIDDLIHTARLLKEDKAFSIIAILPERDRAMITKAANLRLDGYLVAPFTSDYLYEKISPIMDTMIPVKSG